MRFLPVCYLNTQKKKTKCTWYWGFLTTPSFELSGTTQLWKVLEPRLGPLTDNFWTVSALFSASQSWPNFLDIKDEKYFCLVYGLLSPPIGQDFLSATQDFAQKA